MVLHNLLQAFGVARQMLSLVAGSAIDEYLLSQLRLLRQPHTLARLIHALQTKLWPGGVWFQHTAKYMQQHPVSSMHGRPAESSPPANEAADEAADEAAGVTVMLQAFASSAQTPPLACKHAAFPVGLADTVIVSTLSRRRRTPKLPNLKHTGTCCARQSSPEIWCARLSCHERMSDESLPTQNMWCSLRVQTGGVRT